MKNKLPVLGKSLTKGLTNNTRSVPPVHVLISTTNLSKLSFKKNLGKHTGVTSKIYFQVKNLHQQMNSKITSKKHQSNSGPLLKAGVTITRASPL